MEPERNGDILIQASYATDYYPDMGTKGGKRVRDAAEVISQVT